MKLNKHDKVIVVSNSDHFFTGTFQAYDPILDVNIPIIRSDVDDTEYTCFGVILPYDKDIENRLMKLSPDDQYTLACILQGQERDSELNFIIMRGLPGSGKSTKAKSLVGNGQIFSADLYHTDSKGDYNWKRENVRKAHEWNQRRAMHAIDAGISTIIIDNTNTTLKELRAYRSHIIKAAQMGYNIHIVESDTEWAFDVERCFLRNTHNVPMETIRTMKNRYVKDVKWEDILFSRE